MVEYVLAVGGGDDYHLVIGVEAVHFDEDGVEGLFTLIVSAAGEAGSAFSSDGVNLVEENDAGGIILCLLEQVADARGADADEHLDEITAGYAEERHVGFTGDGLGEQRLATAGRAYE